jgi:chromosomal replication initiation ATPase DnaA
VTQSSNEKMIELQNQLISMRRNINMILGSMKLMSPSKREELNEIMSFVSLIFELTTDQIKGPARFPKNIAARRTFSYIAHQKGFKLVDIGKQLNRHHSSIINYLQNFEMYRYNYPEFAQELDSCFEKFEVD